MGCPKKTKKEKRGRKSKKKKKKMTLNLGFIVSSLTFNNIKNIFIILGE